MADRREDKQSVPWLETELARQFCPVSAPQSLWSQIHEQRRPLRVRPHPWTAWSVVTAALLTLFAGFIWRFAITRDTSADLETLARRELRALASGSGEMGIRSGDPEEIQTWVRARSDIRLRLPDQAGTGNVAVRLLGARLIRTGKFSFAVIDYRVGDDFASMLVADRRARFTGSAGSGHNSLRVKSAGDMDLYSWSVGATDYAIAFGGVGEPQRACLLCHADPPALIVFR